MSASDGDVPAVRGGARDAGGVLEVLDGGLLTTIQDGGRPDHGHLGVPESGAADRRSLAIANLLVGNGPDAAAVEMTLAGPTLAARTPITIGLAGADLGGRIRGGRRLPPGHSHRLAGGDIVEFPGDTPGGPQAAARAYLAIRGGIDVPVVLGSRSTCLAGGFGGLDGRPVRGGDALCSAADEARRDRPARGRQAGGRPATPPEPPELSWPERDPGRGAGRPDPALLRVIAGPRPGLDMLEAAPWRVGATADRVGIRLDGPALAAGIGGEATTHGVPWGAIQVPPDGRPIVLGVDHQTTGGYRVVGVVIAADRPVLGQLRPGATVRLEVVDREVALDALRRQRAELAAGAAALREAAGWGRLIDAAGS